MKQLLLQHVRELFSRVTRVVFFWVLGRNHSVNDCFYSTLWKKDDEEWKKEFRHSSIKSFNADDQSSALLLTGAAPRLFPTRGSHWPSLAWNYMNVVSTSHNDCITLWMTRQCSTHSATSNASAGEATNLPTKRRLTATAALQPLKKLSGTEVQDEFLDVSAAAAAGPWVHRRSLGKRDVTRCVFVSVTLTR